MTDLISRADAICEVLVNDGIDNIVDRINDLPSADVVSREDYHNLLMASNDIDRALREYQANEEADAVHGEWKFVDHEVFAGEYFCSICGERAEVDLYGEWILSNYCPSCGARMKGGAE